MRITLIVFTFLFLFSCSPPELPANSSEHNFSVFPNPAIEFISIRVVNSGNTVNTVRVINPDGKEIFSQSVSPGTEGSFNVSLSDQQIGYYYAVLDVGTKSYVQKIAKQ